MLEDSMRWWVLEILRGPKYLDYYGAVVQEGHAGFSISTVGRPKLRNQRFNHFLHLALLQTLDVIAVYLTVKSLLQRLEKLPMLWS